MRYLRATCRVYGLTCGAARHFGERHMGSMQLENVFARFEWTRYDPASGWQQAILRHGIVYQYRHLSVAPMALRDLVEPCGLAEISGDRFYGHSASRFQVFSRSFKSVRAPGRSFLAVHYLVSFAISNSTSAWQSLSRGQKQAKSFPRSSSKFGIGNSVGRPCL